MWLSSFPSARDISTAILRHRQGVKNAPAPKKVSIPPEIWSFLTNRMVIRGQSGALAS